MYSVYSKFKCYLDVLNKLFQTKRKNVFMPIMVEFQMTKVCNLKCSYCYARLEDLRQTDEITLQQIKEIIDELYDMGTRVIRILGGEPLIRDDIGLVIKYIKDKNMFIDLSTNGTLLSKKINEVKELRMLDILSISIDGNRESNDIVRGEGSYNKILEGIKVAKDNGLPVRIHGVLNKASISASSESPVEHLASLSKESNIPFSVCQYCPSTPGEKSETCLSYNEVKPFYELCLALKKRGYRVINSEETLTQIINWPYPCKEILFEEDGYPNYPYFTRCRAGELYCMIDVDGTMCPCTILWRSGLNIWKDGIKKAWQNLSENRRCISCLSSGDIEFTKVFSLFNWRVLLNTFKGVFW